MKAILKMISFFWFLFLAGQIQADEENWYLRYKLISPVEKGVYAKITAASHREPYWFPDFGYLPPSGPDYPWKWIQTGSFSPWFKISKSALNKELSATIILSFGSSSEIRNLKVELQVASNPSNEEIFASKVMESSDNLITFLLPPDLKPGENLITVKEQVKEHLDRSRRSFSSPPPKVEGLTVGTGLSQYTSIFNKASGNYSEELLKMELDTLANYGFDGVNPSWGKETIERNLKYHILHTQIDYDRVWEKDFKSEIEKIVSGLYQQFISESQIEKENIYGIQLADEPALAAGTANYNLDTGHWDKHENAQESFRSYLKRNGLSPSNFGLKDWSGVKLVLKRPNIEDIKRLYPERKSDAARLLHYHTRLFQSYSTWLAFKTATDKIKELFPSSVRTFINLSPPICWNSGGMFCPYSDPPHMGEVDWTEGGRIGATGIQWSEDWLAADGGSAMSMEFVGFIVDMLRAGAKYYDDPLGMHLTASTYLGMKQKSYTSLGRGVKHFNFFEYGPSCVWTDNSTFSESYDLTLKGIGEFTREIEKFSVPISKMKPVFSGVGILWSVSSEIWMESKIFDTEKQMIWLALDRNQVPVNFIMEPDIESEFLNNYKVIYVVGENITKKAAEKIKEWVKDGGILVALPGFGTKDEYNQNQEILAELTGFYEVSKNQAVIKDFTWSYLAIANSIDKVVIGERKDIPVIGDKWKVEKQRGDEIKGIFSDGKPAVILRKFGKGKVYSFGFFPGLAYGKGSNKWRNNNYATQFPEDVAGVILQSIKENDIISPVQIGLDGVQANLLEGKDDAALVLVNYRRDPDKGKIKNLNIKVNFKNSISSVTAPGGDIKFVQTGDTVTFTIDLDGTELVYFH